MKKNLVIPLAALALVVSAGGGIVAAAHADTNTTASSTQTPGTAPAQEQRQKPAALGKMTAINGNSITITDERSNTTYTVDASNAKVQKFSGPTSTNSGGMNRQTPTVISTSDLRIGDTIMVIGTVAGSTITATTINSGMPIGGHGIGQGHGVHGTVTAVNGTTITVKGSDGTIYTVNAASATASKIQTISIGDVSVGDVVGVEGSVNGSSVTATHLMDGIPQNPPMGN